jgi:hypothetical protein
MKILLYFLIFSFVGSVNAADKIEGAFGLKLGDSFEPTGPPKSTRQFGEGFEFTPKKPNLAFSEYLVFVTSQSHLIYRIAAIHREGHEDGKPAGDHTLQFRKCNEVVEKVTAILRQKYQDKPAPNLRIVQGNREVSFTEVRGDAPDSSCEVAVVYEDRDLDSVAGKEAFAEKQKKVIKDADPTGL